jgi:hypothetical protein
MFLVVQKEAFATEKDTAVDGEVKFSLTIN